MDNVTERDYLRTEGDPGASGYAIKEAVALTRSVVLGQRALALHLLSSMLDKALHYICKDRTGQMTKSENKVDKSVDWEASWAFALGPEPELVLSLRYQVITSTSEASKFTIANFIAGNSLLPFTRVVYKFYHLFVA